MDSFAGPREGWFAGPREKLPRSPPLAVGGVKGRKPGRELVVVERDSLPRFPIAGCEPEPRRPETVCVPPDRMPERSAGEFPARGELKKRCEEGGAWRIVPAFASRPLGL